MKFIVAFLCLFQVLSTFSFEAYYRNDAFPMASSSRDPYFKNIQPILDKRCVACHSCREAECRLKLTSPEGVERGGSEEIIHGKPFAKVKRTKLFHDAKTIKEWRKKGFYSVTDTAKYLKKFKSEKQGRVIESSSIFSAAISNMFNPDAIKNPVNLLGTGQQSCGAGNKDLNLVPAMPYKMAPLDFEKEYLTLFEWAQNNEGTYFPPPSYIKKITTPNNPGLIRKWENFFNHPTNYAKWTSRFLYEHLFLARFYFEEAPGEFFELVRSSNQFSDDIDVLGTTHAWKNPNKKGKFYYRLRKTHSTIVFKNHMVYKVNDKTLQGLKDKFWNVSWNGQKNKKFNFKNTNPLVAFKHVPARARYSWMLENAHLLLDISARAQNCRSAEAGAPYWDNMLHLFVKPDSDATVVYEEEFYKKAGKHLPIPRLTKGKDNNLVFINTDFKDEQVKYAKVKRQYQEKLKPNGFTLEDIWDDQNPNALITVLRHGWTASAHKGQLGGNPRSVLLLDFAIFERYFYLCNVATEVSDKMLNQIAVVDYLFDIKKEAEDQFLSLIPEQFRNAIRENLVQDSTAKKEFRAKFALKYNEANDRVLLDPKMPKESFTKNLLITYYSPEAVGKLSHVVRSPEAKKDSTLKELEKLNVEAKFSSYMPNVTYLRVQGEGLKVNYYTLLPNRYFMSRNKIKRIGNGDYERSLRIKTKDRLESFDGIMVNYPEKIYLVDQKNLQQFIRDMRSLNSREAFLSFNHEYGLDQNDSRFWDFIDEANADFIGKNPIEGGILDLHRYGRIDRVEPI